jgi:hypothetical protein
MDWKLYETQPNKIQFINAGLGNAFDTSFCMTFSTLKPYQDIFNYQIKYDKLIKEKVAWLRDSHYFNSKGQLDFSVRYTGTMAHTTIYGNTQWNVCNAIYAYGLIPESMHPNTANSWIEYSDESKITPEMKKMGAEFLKRFDLDNFSATLKDLDKSPIQAIVKFADGDNILSPEGKTNHGAVITYEEVDCVDISDSYWSEHKRYAKDKVFYLKGFTLKEKPTNQISMDTINFINSHEKKIIFEGTPDSLGRFGIIINGQNRLITPDRASQACLYALVNARTSPFGATIQTDLFDAIPKGLNF